MSVNGQAEFRPGSYPGDYGFGLEEDLSAAYPHRMEPKLLLMGLKRCGKSSIHKVVFHRMAPNETLFLESTSKPVKEDISSSSFIQLQMMEFPGQIDLDHNYDMEANFSGTGSLIFVIDSQEDYENAIDKVGQQVKAANAVNPDLRFEVFIHKVDGLTDDQKIEVQRDIAAKVNDKLRFINLAGKISLSFYLTSIYDHSIFDACSRVVQKLIPELSTLEALINIFIWSSGIDKAFLFDVASKIYVATDQAPVDPQAYELCCDMIEVVSDVSSIYGRGAGHSIIDSKTTSSIKLNNNTVLYLQGINECLALVSIVRSDKFEKQGLIDYNFHCFKESIEKVFAMRRKQQHTQNNNNNNESARSHNSIASMGGESNDFIDGEPPPPEFTSTTTITGAGSSSASGIEEGAGDDGSSIGVVSNSSQHASQTGGNSEGQPL